MRFCPFELTNLKVTHPAPAGGAVHIRKISVLDKSLLSETVFIQSSLNFDSESPNN